MAKALEGIRVLDLTQWFQGPVCAQYLADFGAEVIHVERPVTGDAARGVRSIKALPVGDWNQYFLVINRNKKSIAIDLKKKEGQELFYKLVEKSDVLLSNMMTSFLTSIGITKEKILEVNPKIIYATNTGYGQAGGFEKPSYDINVQALTGLMTRQGEPGQPPIYIGMGSGDAYGGIMSALGILMALYHRKQTGNGQYIDASLYGAQLFMSAPTLQPFLASGRSFYSTQQSRTQAGNPLWNRYKAKDQWLYLCAENTQGNWGRLCESFGRDDLASDARFDSPERRAENNADCIKAIDEVIAGETVQQWLDRWTPTGIVASAIGTLKDISEDPQAWENDYLVKTHCGEVDREVDVRGFPISMSETPGTIESLGPELGQDTEILLMEILEMEWDRIEELKAEGVIP